MPSLACWPRCPDGPVVGQLRTTADTSPFQPRVCKAEGPVPHSTFQQGTEAAEALGCPRLKGERMAGEGRGGKVEEERDEGRGAEGMGTEEGRGGE